MLVLWILVDTVSSDCKSAMYIESKARSDGKLGKVSDPILKFIT